MSRRTRRYPLLAIVIAPLLVAASCGDSNGMSDEEVLDRLERAGHTPAGAECILRGTSEQGVSLGRIMDQMRINQRDDEVVRTVTAYCVDQHGSVDVDDDGEGDVVGPVVPTTTAG